MTTFGFIGNEGTMKKIVLTIGILCIFMCVGCGKKEELVESNSISTSISLEDEINDTLNEIDEASEVEYVYDYQVSLDQIPDIFAAVGEPVCGTIHAYPALIQMMYSTVLIGYDEAMYAQYEADKKIVEEYLLATYGKEYNVIPYYVGIMYIYTEEDSEEAYMVAVLGDGENRAVTSDSHNYEESGKELGSDLVKVLEDNIQDEYVYKLYCENVEPSRILHIDIAIFKEEMPDLIQEQKIAIEIYKKMKEIQKAQNDELFFIAFEIRYYPKQYEYVITEQFNSYLLNDILWTNEEKIKKLIENKEMYSDFYFSNLFSDETALKETLQNNNDELLPYWR